MSRLRPFPSGLTVICSSGLLQGPVLYKEGRFFDCISPKPLPDGEIRELFESSNHELFVSVVFWPSLHWDGSVELSDQVVSTISGRGHD
jgi:hypothetical protein